MITCQCQRIIYSFIKPIPVKFRSRIAQCQIRRNLHHNISLYYVGFSQLISTASEINRHVSIFENRQRSNLKKLPNLFNLLVYFSRKSRQIKIVLKILVIQITEYSPFFLQRFIRFYFSTYRIISTLQIQPIFHAGIKHPGKLHGNIDRQVLFTIHKATDVFRSSIQPFCEIILGQSAFFNCFANIIARMKSYFIIIFYIITHNGC